MTSDEDWYAAQRSLLVDEDQMPLAALLQSGRAPPPFIWELVGNMLAAGAQYETRDLTKRTGKSQKLQWKVEDIQHAEGENGQKPDKVAEQMREANLKKPDCFVFHRDGHTRQRMATQERGIALGLAVLETMTQQADQKPTHYVKRRGGKLLKVQPKARTLTHEEAVEKVAKRTRAAKRTVAGSVTLARNLPDALKKSAKKI